jgi:hypothetical protein
MKADFLPPSVVDIQDKDAIALLQQLQRRVVQVPFEQGKTALAKLSVGITTAYGKPLSRSLRFLT